MIKKFRCKVCRKEITLVYLPIIAEKTKKYFDDLLENKICERCSNKNIWEF